MGNGFAVPEDQGRTQRRDNKPPPASKRAINNLPVVQITADDLIEETNKECLICLETHSIGMMSSKLPCGHLFHKPCLAEWLVKQCTCPVCRYELETEDSEFEASRKQRMKDRKLRFRKDELKNQTIHQLKELCTKLSISTNDCIDKQEIVEKIIRSGKVIVTDGIPPIEMTEEDFHAKNVSELKHLLLAFGLSSEGALEKSDLRNRLLESGRIVIITSSSSGTMEMDPPLKNGDNTAQLKGSIGSFGESGSYISYSREELRNMSLSGLRELCRRYQIDITTCLDKSEVIEAMIRARNFPVKPDSTIESNSYKEPDPTFQQPSSSSLPPPRSRANSQHGASPSSFIRSRSSSYDPTSSSRKRSLSNASSKSHNEPTVIMPPYAHTVNLQEPNYSPRSNSSDFYNTEPLDQAINYIGQMIHSATNDITSQLQSMYQQTQLATRSRSSSNALSTPPRANTSSRASSSTTSTPPQQQQQQQQRPSSTENGEEHREKLILSRELLESFSILEIKMILDSYGIHSEGCVDKYDHIHALEHSSFVEIVD